MTVIRNGFQSADLDVPVVLPTLNLDFANSQKLDPRITFSRGSIGTFVNKNGLIETAPANQPRFDYDPISGECRGLLIEESRQNLLTYSEDFSNAVWSKFNLNLGSIFITSPNGQSTAYKLIVNSTNFVHQLYSVSSGTINTTYTLSMYVKAGEYSRFGFGPGNAAVGGNDRIVRINLNATNPILSQDAIFNNSAFATSVGNGWYRVGATWTATSTGTMTIGLLSRLQNNSGSDSFSGDETSGIYIWGAQLEAGSFPTSYIPTGASTVTRSAELADMTGTNFSSWYNSTEGTFFLDGTLPFITNDSVTSGARVPFGVSNGFSFANSMYVAKGNTSLALSFSVVSNSVGQTGAVTTTMTSSRFKISAAFADRNIYSCGYGGTVNKLIRPSASIPTVSRLTLGREPWNVGTSNPIIGHITRFTYYPRALSPAQLQYLTQ